MMSPKFLLFYIHFWGLFVIKQRKILQYLCYIPRKFCVMPTSPKSVTMVSPILGFLNLEPPPFLVKKVATHFFFRRRGGYKPRIKLIRLLIY